MSRVPVCLDPKLKELVPKVRVLVVGAGGIGCEILKNLALTGFRNVEVIDLDTIDVSNLNRQFLFRREHVGKPKALVAKESVLGFNPDLNITAYHDSIKSPDYGVDFFKRFDIVLNALDNRSARSHVNRLCLVANVPLIESGTAGYSGQVEFIKKGLTQCYECVPAAAQRTYPGCTIRNTPSEPVHCIVWAKHLFNQLFGEEDADHEVSPDAADPEAVGDAGSAAVNGDFERVSTRKWAEEIDYDATKLFTKFFEDDIKYLLSMENLWKSRTPPVPLSMDSADGAAGPVSSSGAEQQPSLRSMRVWDVPKCVAVFTDTVAALRRRLRDKAPDYLVWDKDDKACIEFVTACANIRAHVFGIQKKSLFDVKSIAGNIIPAIASANAIIAGLVVLLAFRALNEEYDRLQYVYLREFVNHRNQLIIPERCLPKPNPKCYVCSPKPEVTACVNLTKMTLKEFNTEVLKKSLNMVAPDVVVGDKIVISGDEDENVDNNHKFLLDMGVTDGCVLKVDDYLQNYTLLVFVKHYETQDKNEPPFRIIADADQLKAKDDDDNGDLRSNGNNDRDYASDDDDLMLVADCDDDPEPLRPSPVKRLKIDDDVMLVDCDQ